MTAKTGLATTNGASFYYEVAGEGAPVVLIHAGIADGRMWDDLFAALAGSYRVVRYDMRGFGRTAPVEGPFAHPNDLAALLAQWGMERASLVGCSMGSKTALDFTLAHPERVERLVLTSPAVSGLAYDGPRPPQAEAIDAAEDAGDIARVNELETQLWFDGPRRPEEVEGRLRALVLEMNGIALANEGVGEEQPPPAPAFGRVGEVVAPALVVVGELDVARTLAAADYLAAELPGARHEVIAGATHLPNMERPEEFNRLVVGFLGSSVIPD